MIAILMLLQGVSALPDPLAAGWEAKATCELLRENDEMRAFKCTFPPGVGHERHYHPPHFGYILEGGKMQITDDAGMRVQETPAGASGWSDGVARSVECRGYDDRLCDRRTENWEAAMIVSQYMLKAVLAAACIAALAVTGGCATVSSPAEAACAAGEEAVRVGPRGKGDAPRYVCRTASE